MQITRVLTSNALDPLSRDIEKIEPDRTTIRGALPDGWGSDPGQTMVFLNSKRCEDWEREVMDGDIVHFFGGVTDATTVGLIVLSIMSSVVAYAMMPKIPTTAPAANPDGGATYGYYGFTNSFRAEGDPIPVVYGKLRVAPPVVNQIIAANGASLGLSLSVREDMYLLLAVSEGPIQGLGKYEGVVETQADQDALTGGGGFSKKGTGLQINGIPGNNFIGFINWRTGTLNQQAFAGSSGYINYNDTSVVYAIELTPLNGQTGSISDTAFPPGSYAHGSASLLSNAIATEYISQQIATSVDRSLVQILFERGLYEQNTDGGFSPVTKTVRIQYRETDSGGTGTGNWTLLPAFLMTSNKQVTQVIDIPIDFVSPGTYVSAVQAGYYQSESQGNDYLRNNDTDGHVLMRPTGYWERTQQWTMGCWVSSRDNSGQDGNNHAIFGVNYPATNNTPIDINAGTFHGPRADYVDAGDSGFQVWLRRDVSGAFGATDRMYLVLECFDNSSADRYLRWMVDVGNYDSWGGNHGQSDPSAYWEHIAIRYDGQAVGGTQVTAFVSGIPYAMSWSIVGTGAGTPDSIFPKWASVSTNWQMGIYQRYTTAAGYVENNTDMAEFFLYDGLVDDSTITLVGNPALGVDQFGHKINGVRSIFEGDPLSLIVMPLSGSESASGNDYYRNYADNATGTVTVTLGSWVANGGTGAVKTTGGPIWTSPTGTSKKSYWLVEVFVSTQTSSTQQQDAATISTITGLSSQPYVYPSTALASVNVEANEQVNNQQPAITMIVKGRIVNTWDGSLDGDGNPDLLPAWSRNPAWIAADLLTNERYGLGSELSSAAIDWPSFLSWADFCDEGVPDAFGDVTIFGIRAEGNAVHSTEQLVRLYIGLTPTATATANTIPKTWTLPATADGESTASVSINSIAASGISAEWKTSDDIATGLNQASNQLGIHSITHFDATNFHGYDIYAEVRLRWNRLDGSSGLPIWPTGVVTGNEFFNDEFEPDPTFSLGSASGYEPRCLFDGVFDQQGQSAWEAILQIFSAGRAMPIKAGKKIYASVDRPRPVVGVFGQGNIINETLEITYTGPLQSPNSVEGDILDEAANYERRTVQVDHSSIQDPDLFDTYRKERTDFRGVVRASQAMRDATYRLNKYFLTRRHAKFSVGPDAINLLPGDRILVSHDVPQYGYSGRLRGDQVIKNTFPNGGSLYQSWDKAGGPCALTYGGILQEDASIASPITSDRKVVEMVALPTTGDVAGPAASQGQDGSDVSLANTPRWAVQQVCTGSQLYPPNTTYGPLAQITSAAYTCAYSIYVKESALGAADVIRLNIYRLVDGSGTPVNSEKINDFTWASGAITSTYTQSGITASVTSVGSGWYRIGAVYDNAVAGGAVNDFLQARVYIGTNSGSHDGSFLPVASGGKGTNFLKWGDPMDCEQSDWTRYNHGTSTISIANVAIAPPFYTPTDGTYGEVAKLFKPAAIANGTTPPNLVQTHTLTTGAGVANWSNETITLTGYARMDAANGANDTNLYVSLRYAATVDGNNKLNGDGGLFTFTGNSGGSAWAASGTPAKTEASGTVNSISHSLAYVRQNSSTDDANWVQFNCSIAYTPSAGHPATISVGVFADSGGTASGGDTAIDVWGLRLHGKSSGAVATSNYYHRKMLFAGAMFEEGVTSISTFEEGARIKLDRDVTLTTGNSYEVLLRSSFAPDLINNSDNSEVIAVDGSEVPGSGSTIKAANADLKVSAPTKFTAHEGDLYSFGKSNQTSEDFIISRITLDPTTMHRAIECDEYNEAVYVDTDFGTTGTATISDLPSVQAQEVASSQSGIGLPTSGAYGGRSVFFEVRDETESDQSGNFIPRLGIYWRWPIGMQVPREMRLYMARDVRTSDRLGASDPPEYIGTSPITNGFFSYSDPLLLRGQTYRVYFQAVGITGSASSIIASPYRLISIRKTANPSTLLAPTVSTATRGWQQMYFLDRISTTRVVDVIEGRLGGWKLGAPAFIIDPDISNTASDSTLVGQLSGSTGRTGMRVFCRSRTAQGHYGQHSRLTGTEQLKDVLYDHSTATEGNYASGGAVSGDLDVIDNVMSFKASSSALSATYLPAQIDLGSAKRVLVNCVAEATQVRPETLADLPYSLGSAEMRRWSFEGPMDDLDGDDAELLIEWRWSSTSSTGSDTYRKFRPGEVYAERIDFRVTFIRPTASYDIRMTRLVVQALIPPNFSPGDLDGGTFA